MLTTPPVEDVECVSYVQIPETLIWLQATLCKDSSEASGLQGWRLELLLPLWGSALLAPFTEHLGSIAGHFEGFGEKVIQEGRAGLVETVGEFSTGPSACQSRHKTYTM